MVKNKSEATLAEYERALARACSRLAPVVVAYGQEEYLRRQAVESFLEALQRKYPQIEILTLHCAASAKEDRLTLASVVDELENNSLFAAERAIVLRRAEHILFGGKAASEKLEEDSKTGKGGDTAEARLLTYLAKPTPGIWLIIETGALDRRLRLGKTLTAKAEIIPCPEVRQHADLLHWVRQRARYWHKEIESRAAEMLIASYGPRLGELSAEVEKLAIFAGARQTLTVEDVAHFLRGSLEFEIFSLTQAVEKRSLPEALLYAQRIVKEGVRDQAGRKTDGESSGHMAMALLGRTLQGLLSARLAVASGETPQALSERLSLHPYRAQRLYEAASKFTLRDLRQAIATLAEECRVSHDTGGDIKVSLLRAVIACCGRDRQVRG